MPGIVIHSLLATRVFDAWREAADPPFDTQSQAVRNAFLCGAMGPDMGYFPGGDRLISDVSHYLRTGELARELLRQAQTDEQTAFAWGWVTHILADVLIHPLLNRASGERRFGERDRPLSYDDDLVLHVQFEVGVDAICGLARWRGEPAWLRPVFDATNAEYLQRCFAGTYGDGAASAESLLRSHQACVRYSRINWNLARVIHSRLRGRLAPSSCWAFYLLLYVPVKVGASLAARRHPLYGATHAFKPPEWLAEAVATVIDEFPATFFQLASVGLAAFPDYNLDLGVVESEPPDYRLTLAANEQLATRTRRS